MSGWARLIPFLCVGCSQPILAQPGEVAWVCSMCGKGTQLVQSNIKPLDVFFSPKVPVGKVGRPFWVTQGQVKLQKRITYRGNDEQESIRFWSEPRTFYIPAYEEPLETSVATGLALLRQPEILSATGNPVPFLPIVTPPEDVRPMAEFMVLALEADRRDALKTLNFDLTFLPPQLWILS